MKRAGIKEWFEAICLNVALFGFAIGWLFNNFVPLTKPHHTWQCSLTETAEEIK